MHSRIGRGYVYFIEGADKIKIGISIGKPEKRMQQLQTGSPVPLKLIGYILTHDASELEDELHNYFRYGWAYGEWFYTNSKILNYIDSNAIIVNIEQKKIGNSRVTGIPTY